MATSSSQLRQLIAREATRMMAQEYITDFQTAKTKAAIRVHGSVPRHLPNNSEIEEALLEYQRLFHADRQPETLRRQRESALSAMQLLAEFQPRLVGPVLAGTAMEHADIQLHLFSDTHEDVAMCLMDNSIPHELKEKHFKSVNRRYPAYRFVAGDDTFFLVVFPLREMRQPLPDPVTGKAMRRADAATVAGLVEAAYADADGEML